MGTVRLVQIKLFIFTSLFFLASAVSGQTLKVAYSERWAPYSYINSAGRADGIFVDLINDIFADQLGFRVKHYVLPWKRAQRLVETGKYDALMAVPTAERLAFAKPSRSILYKLQVKAFIARESARYRQLLTALNPLQLTDVKCVLMAGDRSSKEITTRHSLTCAEVTSVKQALNMLSIGRAEVFVHANAVVRPMLDDLQLHHLISAHDVTLKITPLVLLVSKQSKHFQDLIPRLDRAIDLREVRIPIQ